jgi:hypothetical protein
MTEKKITLRRRDAENPQDAEKISGKTLAQRTKDERCGLSEETTGQGKSNDYAGR